MTKDLVSLHADALEHTGSIFHGVRSDQWHVPTPDTEWDLRALANHIVSENAWVPPLVEGKSIEEVGDRFDGNVLGHDPIAAYDRSAEAAADAFRAGGAMGAPVHVSYGPISGEEFAKHRLMDVVIHGWDMAKATGQSPSIPEPLVDAVYDIIIEQADMISGSGVFGPKVNVRDDAPKQTRLLALVGRKA